MKASDYLAEQAQRLRLLEEHAEDGRPQLQEAVEELGKCMRESVDHEFERWKRVLQMAANEGDSVEHDGEST